MTKTNVSRNSSQKIVIDEAKGLVFADETELFAHFSKEIQTLEEKFFAWRHADDIDESQFADYESHLNKLLEDPDEVWEDRETLPGVTLTTYIRHFEDKTKDEPLFHLAVAYMTGDTPSFVYLHFPTRDLSLVEKYQRQELIYDRIFKDAPAGSLEGDALLEGDELAIGLYKAMLLLRGEKDIPEEQFREYADFRETTIEEADEIWRSNDSMGNVLVSFIKDFSEEGQDLTYVVVTLEDTPSNSHALLFSFPTNDKNLVGRYRHGENLQADEVVQEASH